MTLSREEIRRDVAVRMACALIARDGYDDEGAPRDAVTLADALLAALTPTPAPVAPPAGKYEPRVGDRLTFPSAPRAEYIITEIDVCGVVYGKVRNVDDSEWGYWCGGSASEVARHVETWRSATPKEREDVGLNVVPAAGLAVPPPAPTPAPEDDAAANARIDAILDDRKDADAIKAAAVRQRAEHRATYGPESPAPEAKCEMCGGPHVRDVFHAADLQPPAPEAKRPMYVCITGPKDHRSVTIGKVYEVLYFDDDRARLIIKNDDGVEWGLSNKPDEGPAFPTWAPAPCPPPVAGSAEDADLDAILSDCLTVVDGQAWSAAPESDRRVRMIALGRRIATARAALSRPVRP